MRARAWLVGVPLVVMVVYVAGGWAIGRVARVRAERACLVYVAPAERVVYADDPAVAVALSRRAGYAAGVYAYSYACTTRMYERVALHDPPEPRAYYGRVLRESMPVDTAPVFCHGRRSAGGNSRLVMVTVRGGGGAVGLVAESFARLDPFGGGAAPVRQGYTVCRLATMSGRPTPPPPPDRLRLYAGQPDPADASAFTIRYEVVPADGSGVIPGQLTGRLGDDDEVRLTVTAGPAVIGF